MTKRYQPRRAGARWLQGAPREILDCFDSGENAGADRYTVIMADPYIYHTTRESACVPGAGEFKNTWLAYLGSSAEMGVSGWGEFTAYDAANYRFRNGHRRIKWAAVPPAIRRYLVGEIRRDAKEAAKEKAAGRTKRA